MCTNNPMTNLCKEPAKWFINSKNQIRYAHTFLKMYDEFDFHSEHLVVSMDNNQNAPTINTCLIESVNTKNFFDTRRDCEFEIIRKERFEK